MKRFALIYIFLAIAGNFAFSQTPSDYSFKENYAVSSPAEISISTSDGYINVNSHKTNDIEVYFIVRKNNRVLDIDLEELRDHLEVDISSGKDFLEIEVRRRESSWMKNWKDQYNVSFQINAPQRTMCDLKSSDGDIALNGMRGTQNCKTSDGDIEVEDVIGDLTARTSDGDVRIFNIQGDTDLVTSDGDIDVENIEGDVSFKTSDGKISARNIDGDTRLVTSDGNIFLDNINGENNARTSDGNIVFEDMSGSLTAQTSDGDIRGNFVKVTSKLYLKTSDGNISVTVPEGLGMDLRLKGEDIYTRLDNFSGNTDDNLVEGTIRGGGVEVEMVTSDGNINLDYN